MPDLTPPTTVRELTSPGALISYRARVERTVTRVLDEVGPEFMRSARSMMLAEGVNLRRVQVEEEWSTLVTRAVSEFISDEQVRGQVLADLLESELPADVYQSAIDLMTTASSHQWSRSVVELFVKELFPDDHLGRDEAMTAAGLFDGWDLTGIGLLGLMSISVLRRFFRDAKAGREPEFSSEEEKEGFGKVSGLVAGAGAWVRRLRQLRRDSANRTANSQVNEQIGEAKVQGKRWVSLRDGRVRETHSAADGQIVGQKESFIVGGYAMRFPRDPLAPIEETINCRCFIAAVVGRG